jgi:hypothetical protein
VITALDDLAGLDYQEQIGVPNRAQAVRDNEAGGCPSAVAPPDVPPPAMQSSPHQISAATVVGARITWKW